MSPVAPLTEHPAGTEQVAVRSASPSIAVPSARARSTRGARSPEAPSHAAPPRRAASKQKYKLRGRHARERGRLRVPVPLSVAHVGIAEDRQVLQVLRTHAVTDLDAAQVAALSALPPSVAVPSLDRLVQLGLVRRQVVGGHERYGLP